MDMPERSVSFKAKSTAIAIVNDAPFGMVEPEIICFNPLLLMGE